MAENTNQITNQIAKVQTNKKLIALYDKLKEAPVESYAQIHAKRNEINGSKQTSLIGIQVYDYSNGTGTNNIIVSFNLEPEQIQFLLTRLTAGFQDFEWGSDKIFGNPDAQGYCIAQKFYITRHNVDKDGQVLRSPWRISIQNGKGIKVMNSNGGSYMKGGSYKVEKQAFISLSDMDMYMLLKRADAYITSWELVSGAKLITAGKPAYENYVAQQRMSARQNNNGYTGQNNGYAEQGNNAGYPAQGDYQAGGYNPAPAPNDFQPAYATPDGNTQTNAYGQPVSGFVPNAQPAQPEWGGGYPA